MNLYISTCLSKVCKKNLIIRYRTSNNITHMGTIEYWKIEYTLRSCLTVIGYSINNSVVNDLTLMWIITVQMVFRILTLVCVRPWSIKAVTGQQLVRVKGCLQFLLSLYRMIKRSSSIVTILLFTMWGSLYTLLFFWTKMYVLNSV